MSENKEKNLDDSVSKALLYSEILGTSVAEHVQEVVQKKKKSSTFHVKKSAVMGRVSKVIQSLKEAENDVQVVEIDPGREPEGERVVDMDVLLIRGNDKKGSKSDNSMGNEDLEDGVKDRKQIVIAESDSDMSGNESEENATDSDSEWSENESKDNQLKKMILSSDLGIKEYKGEKNIVNDTYVVTTSGLEDKRQSEMNLLKESKLFTSNSNKEQFENTRSKCVLGEQNNKFEDSDEELLEKEYREAQAKQREQKLKLKQTTSVSPDSSYKNQSYLNNSGCSDQENRKLITVIEEVSEQNMCPSTKQKKV